MEDPGLAAAREAAGGKNVDLANLLGLTESAISQWKRVPYRRAVEIEEKTGGKVTRYQMRPDIFGGKGKTESQPKEPPARRSRARGAYPRRAAA